MSRVRYELIVTIVEKGLSAKVIDAAKSGGAEGSTVLFGRGSGIHEKARFFGITIEPEKEVVMIMVADKICGKVLSAIEREVELDKPGNGICFVIDISRVIGLNHPHVFEEEE